MFFFSFFPSNSVLPVHGAIAWVRNNIFVSHTQNSFSSKAMSCPSSERDPCPFLEEKSLLSVGGAGVGVARSQALSLGPAAHAPGPPDLRKLLLAKG